MSQPQRSVSDLVALFGDTMTTPEERQRQLERAEQERIKYVEELAASLPSLKGHLTRRLNAAKSCLNLDAAPSDSMAQAYEEHQERVRDYWHRVRDTYSNVMDNDVAEKRPQWLAKFNETEDAVGLVLDALTVKLSKCEALHHPQPVAPAAPQGPRVVCKPQSDLKPKELTRDFSATSLRSWQRSFQDYFNTSNMQAASIEQQHAYLFSCFEDFLAIKLRPLVIDEEGDLLPLFSPHPYQRTCMHVIDEEFRLTYPLFVRRKEFLDIRQPRDMKFTDYAARLERLGLEASLETFTGDELMKSKFLSSCSDSKLLERFLREPIPSKDDLLRIAQQYQVGKVYDQAIRTDGSKVTSSKAQSQSGARPKSGKGQDKKGDDKKKKGPTCLRCGRSKPQAGPHEKCPAAEADCKKCGKKGHFAQVCLTKKIPDKAHAASSQQQQKKKQTAAKSANVKDEAEFVATSNQQDAEVIRANASRQSGSTYGGLFPAPGGGFQ